MGNAPISVVVTTCDELQNAEFAQPVDMAFGAAFALKDMGLTEEQLKDPNTVVPVADCNYYDPVLYLWRSEGPATYNSTTGKYICQATHLTYFSMLFKDGDQDNNTLTIIDNVLTILSLVCSFFLILWKCFMSEQAVWIRLGLRPMERSYLQLAIALFCTNITFLVGADMRTPAYEDLEACTAVAGILHWTILWLFFTTLETSVNMISPLFGWRFNRFQDWWKKIINLLLMPLISFIIVIAIIESLKEEPKHFYGGIFDQAKTYLNRRELSSGKTLCFVHSETDSFYFGLILIYALAMASVILVYAITAYKILTTAETDMMKIDQTKNNAKKLFFVFFTIGATWLLLILTMVAPGEIAMDYLFVIFKGLQMPVLTWIAVGREVKTWIKDGNWFRFDVITWFTKVRIGFEKMMRKLSCGKCFKKKSATAMS